MSTGIGARQRSGKDGGRTILQELAMYIGVDYYPEHWPRERWEQDARQMREAGFNVVRLAEFAWVNIEPRENHFDFAWLDDALAILHRHGISAILGTPTAAMPAWLARRYPDCLLTLPDGRRQRWGSRKDNCFGTPTYRRHSRRITTALARHYARHPALIGWQTDNEFGMGAVPCFCPHCHRSFHQFLRAKYQTLAELNRAWGTHFWGHAFSAWDQIPIPDNPAASNPSALLDWRRHYSFQTVDFQHEQVNILRRLCPEHFITHNCIGLYSEINYRDLARDLDFVSNDIYPVWGEAPSVTCQAGLDADVARGLKPGRGFWVMETTAGPHGWAALGRNPRPGEMRKNIFQYVARGAENILWFRWRTCTAGREQYWHGLLGHDGKIGRRYQEAADIARKLHALAPRLQDTRVHAPVAIINDYESGWAFNFQHAMGGQCFTANKGNYHDALRRYHHALFRAGVTADIISPDGDFSQYQAVIAPQLYLLPDERARRLIHYVEQGGVLLADVRTGVKDETSLCHARTLPGLLRETLGLEIHEYEGMDAGKLEYALRGRGPLAGKFTAMLFADWITPTTAQTLVAYAVPHLKNYAAATLNKCGKGAACYVGTVVKEPAFYDQLMAHLLHLAKIKPRIIPPAGVEVVERVGPGVRQWFVINHGEEKKTIPLPGKLTDAVTGARVKSPLRLEPWGTAVLQAKEG